MKIVNGIIQDINIPGVTLVVDLIPNGRKRRPGISMQPKYVTIHNTGCDKVPADNFRRAQLDVTQDKEVSWHLTVDEKTIIQHLPITEVAWRAGNRDGNYTSFGIETCERAGAEEVVIKFVAEVLKYFDWTTNNVKSHKSWSGKQCPWKILPHWESFLINIGDATSSTDKPLVEAVKKIVASGIKINDASWNDVSKINLNNVPTLLTKLGGLDKLVADKVISDKQLWLTKQYNANHVRALLIKYASKLG